MSYIKNSNKNSNFTQGAKESTVVSECTVSLTRARGCHYFYCNPSRRSAQWLTHKISHFNPRPIYYSLSITIMCFTFYFQPFPPVSSFREFGFNSFFSTLSRIWLTFSTLVLRRKLQVFERHLHWGFEKSFFFGRGLKSAFYTTQRPIPGEKVALAL